MSNYLIPLMVVVPMLCAILVNAFAKFNKSIKVLTFVVAICLPIIPLLSNYGLHFFGGYTPMLDNATGVIYHPAITYAFDMLQQIFIAAVGLITFLFTCQNIKKHPDSICSYCSWVQHL